VVFPEPDTPMTVISGGGEGEVGIFAVLSSRRSVLRTSVPV